MLRHFERKGATEAVSTEHVRTVRLNLADFIDVALCDMLELSIDRRTSIETGGLEAKDRLIGAKMSGQIEIRQDLAVGRVHQK